MISIIVPVYNAEKYLESCIVSILGQTETDFELILVNDGSKDSSGSICRKFAKQDSRIIYIEKKNAGVGEARNTGIESAKGEWICFIDSDDQVRSDYLSAFDVKNTNADIIISGIDFININNNKVMRREQYPASKINIATDRKALIPLLPIGFPVAKAYRREILNRYDLRFPTDISFHEDHVFVFDCYLHSKIIEVRPDITYLYCIDYSNLSLSKKKHAWQKHWTASMYMFDRIFKIKNCFGYNDNELRQIYSFAYEPVISAVYDLYDSDYKRRDRITIIRQLLKDKLPIEQLFYPKSKRGKIIKAASRILPEIMLDIFFVAVNRYQNRRK